MTDEKRPDPTPSADDAHENKAAGDDAMQDDLTGPRDADPVKRADTSDTIAMDP